MDTTLQIQGIKTHIDNIKLQIDNIEMQNNNALMIINPISDQLLNLSMQMLNTGLQTFNIGSNLSMNMNMNKYYDQLSEISERINDILISNQNIIQNMVIQPQQMMNQMFPIPMIEQPIMVEKYKINVVFESSSWDRLNMIVD